MTPLLEVDGLAVRYPSGAQALRGVDLVLQRGEVVAVVGESGSGKTTLARALAGLVPAPLAQGRVLVDGEDLLTATPERLRALRWATVALGVQGAPFNPVVRVGEQVAELLRTRLGTPRRRVEAELGRLAGAVGLDPALFDRYPHELSGGERQRALLAMVLALDPALGVLDEPTAGLDAVTRAEVLEQISALCGERGFALVLVTHDLPAAAALAPTVSVLYAGRVVEQGPTGRLLEDPRHPYTFSLVAATPLLSTTKDLRPIRGSPPDSRALPGGCAFHPRCTQAEPSCRTDPPRLAPVQGRLVSCHLGGIRTLLEGRGLTKSFGSGQRRVEALRAVSLVVREGEAVGVVGRSGSGKSTLARILAGDLLPDSGEVLLEGAPLPTSFCPADRRRRRRVQLVLQDPWDALSPRLSVAAALEEPLVLDGDPGPAARTERLRALLGEVGLPTDGPFLAAHVHELSGGQLQRVALARALLAEPKVLVADEPTAMLDGSEQARLLVLLRRLQVELGLGLVLVSHDLAAVRKVTDQIVVLDHGAVVERGPSHTVATAPGSTAGAQLLAAAFDLDRRRTGSAGGPAPTANTAPRSPEPLEKGEARHVG